MRCKHCNKNIQPCSCSFSQCEGYRHKDTMDNKLGIQYNHFCVYSLSANPLSYLLKEVAESRTK